MELKPLNIDLIPEPLRARLLAGQPVAWAVDGEPTDTACTCGKSWVRQGHPASAHAVMCPARSLTIAPAPFRGLDRVCPTCGGMNTAHLATLKNESVTRYNHVTTYGTVTGYCVDCHDGRLVVDIVGPCPPTMGSVRLARATVRCLPAVDDMAVALVLTLDPVPRPNQWVVCVEPMTEGF
jgi:hypothetical protein